MPAFGGGEDEDGIIRYAPTDIDSFRSASLNEEGTIARKVAEQLAKFACLSPDAVVQRHLYPPPSAPHHHHHKSTTAHHHHHHHHHHPPNQRLPFQDGGGGGGGPTRFHSSRSGGTFRDGGGTGRHYSIRFSGTSHVHASRQQQHEQRVTGLHQRHHAAAAAPPVSMARRPARPQNGAAAMPSGNRALTSLLNKLSDRNFDAITIQALDLVQTGQVTGCEAARALLTKSVSDGGGYAPLYARLARALMQVDLSATEEIFGFVRMLFGTGRRGVAPREDDDDGEMWVAIKAVSSGLSGATSDEYDGFCAAIKAKRHLVGRHATALSMMTVMPTAEPVPGGHSPIDIGRVADVLLESLGRSGVLVDEDVSAALRASFGGGALNLRDAAIDMTLDLLAMTLRSPLADVHTRQRVRESVRAWSEALQTHRLSPKSRFKVMDVVLDGKR